MKSRKKGQALFEFIIFVPFMLGLYLMTLNFFGGINGSINQQKVTRGYFWARLKWNSNEPSPQNLAALSGVNQAGMFAIGWMNKFVGISPEAPCYKVSSLSSTAVADNCEDVRPDAGPTAFIRPKTMFGICGANYDRATSVDFQPSFRRGAEGACTQQ